MRDCFHISTTINFEAIRFKILKVEYHNSTESIFDFKNL